MEATVLRAVKSALQTGNIVKARSVFFTPHGTFMPSGTSCPAIGIKDGRVVEKEAAGGMVDMTFQVELIAWVDMTMDGEEALVGDPGILPLIKEIKKILASNRLGISKVHHARVLSGTPSQLFRTDNRQWLVKKSVVIQYDLEFSRE